MKIRIKMKMMKTAIGHENLGDKANSKRNII